MSIRTNEDGVFYEVLRKKYRLNGISCKISGTTVRDIGTIEEAVMYEGPRDMLYAPRYRA